MDFVAMLESMRREHRICIEHALRIEGKIQLLEQLIQEQQNAQAITEEYGTCDRSADAC